MLFGEHAVLRGSLALVAAIDCSLTISLTPIPSKNIEIFSSLGTAKSPIDSCSFGKPFHFIEAICKTIAPKLSSGFRLEIASEINPNVGLASSASVTVASLTGIKLLLQEDVSPQQLLQESLQIIRSVQGFGSGADAASIIYGGIISYDPKTLSVEHLAPTLPLVLAYSGSKMKTQDVIAYVNAREKQYPDVYKAIFSGIAQNTVCAKEAIRSQNLSELGNLMIQAQGLMHALGVCSKELLDLYSILLKEETIYGAKISGSGLGDCVVGLGTVSQHEKYTLVPSKVSSRGVLIDGSPLYTA